MTQIKNGNLILISGMPRSGTTWIGKIFDSHPDTIYLHEPDSHIKMNVPLAADIRELASYKRHVLNYVNGLPDNTSIEVRGKMPLFPKRYLSGISQFILKRNIFISKIALRLSLHLPVINVWKQSLEPGTVTVWKSIQSSGRIGVLAGTLKDAKTIQIMRHPAGQVASVLRGQALNKFYSSVDDDNVLRQLLRTAPALRRQETLQDLNKMSNEERQAWKWLIINEKALDDLKGIPEAIIVKYEDICKDPINESKKLFNQTGLSWDPQTENFLGYSTEQTKDGYYSVQKKSLEVANRWRKELTNSQIKKIMAMVSGSPAGRLYDAN